MTQEINLSSIATPSKVGEAEETSATGQGQPGQKCKENASQAQGDATMQDSNNSKQNELAIKETDCRDPARCWEDLFGPVRDHQIFHRGDFGERWFGSFDRVYRPRKRDRSTKFVYIRLMSLTKYQTISAERPATEDEMLDRFNAVVVGLGLPYAAGLLAHSTFDGVDSWSGALYVDRRVLMSRVEANLRRGDRVAYDLQECKTQDFMDRAVLSVIIDHGQWVFEPFAGLGEPKTLGKFAGDEAQEVEGSVRWQVPKKTAHFVVSGDFGAAAARAVRGEGWSDGKFISIVLWTTMANLTDADWMDGDLVSSANDWLHIRLRRAGVGHRTGLICHTVFERESKEGLNVWQCIFEVSKDVSVRDIKARIAALNDFYFAVDEITGPKDLMHLIWSMAIRWCPKRQP